MKLYKGNFDVNETSYILPIEDTNKNRLISKLKKAVKSFGKNGQSGYILVSYDEDNFTQEWEYIFDGKHWKEDYRTIYYN